jgi:hypothetical protein
MPDLLCLKQDTKTCLILEGKLKYVQVNVKKTEIKIIREFRQALQPLRRMREPNSTMRSTWRSFSSRYTEDYQLEILH